jgi:BREX system ATP-binding protein BrxC/D
VNLPGPAGQAVPPSGVLGGGTLKADDYAGFLAREYLAEYLPAGGAAVKVAVVGDGGAADRLESALGTAAAEHHDLFTQISAESTRVHMIDQIFFTISRVVDWELVAAASVRAAYAAASFPVPEGAGITVAEIARHHDVDVRELYRSVRRRLERSLLGNPLVAREMGRAILRLAQAQLGAGDVDAAEHEAVLGWLHGELRSITALRSALIYTRIGRHNARAMLASTAALLLAAGYRGIMVCFDYGRLAEARRPPAEARSGFYYSKAAVLDAYEVLRQFIDATDELRGLLVIAVVPPELMTDEVRGLPAYAALQLRVADEVRDRRQANPFAALVRLEVRLEAVA